jgi:hypothetical protein
MIAESAACILTWYVAAIVQTVSQPGTYRAP